MERKLMSGHKVRRSLLRTGGKCHVNSLTCSLQRNRKEVFTLVMLIVDLVHWADQVVQMVWGMHPEIDALRCNIDMS